MCVCELSYSEGFGYDYTLRVGPCTVSGAAPPAPAGVFAMNRMEYDRCMYACDNQKSERITTLPRAASGGAGSYTAVRYLCVLVWLVHRTAPHASIPLAFACLM